MTRTEQMEHLAAQIETIIKDNGRRNDIAVTYCEMDGVAMEDFTESERERAELFIGHEYFMIWEVQDPYDIDPFHLLYAKNITGDSALTAAAELMTLASYKL